MSQFDDPFDVSRFLRSNAMSEQAPPPRPTPKPLPQVRGKRIEGELYLRADDLADALESQGPKTNRRLIDRLRKAVAS